MVVQFSDLNLRAEHRKEICQAIVFFGHSIVCGKRFVFIIFCLLLYFWTGKTKIIKWELDHVFCLLGLFFCLFLCVFFFFNKPSRLCQLRPPLTKKTQERPMAQTPNLGLSCSLCSCSTGTLSIVLQGKKHHRIHKGKASHPKKAQLGDSWLCWRLCDAYRDAQGLTPCVSESPALAELWGRCPRLAGEELGPQVGELKRSRQERSPKGLHRQKNSFANTK